MCYISVAQVVEPMRIRTCFTSDSESAFADFHRAFMDRCVRTSIKYSLRLHILPRYFSCSDTSDLHPHYAPKIFDRTKTIFASATRWRFYSALRSRWSPIAPSRPEENHSTIDRPAVNIYCRTGSKSEIDS